MYNKHEEFICVCPITDRDRACRWIRIIVEVRGKPVTRHVTNEQVDDWILYNTSPYNRFELRRIIDALNECCSVAPKPCNLICKIKRWFNGL